MSASVIEKTNNSDGSLLIRVTPSEAPYPTKVGLALGAIVGVFAYLSGHEAMAFLLFLVTTVAGTLWFRSSKLNRYREKVTFTLSSKGLELNGQQFPSADIHRVTIKNHLLPELEQEVSEVVITTPRAGHTGRVVGTAIRRDAAKTCYRVEFEAMGSAHILGGGLTEPEAFALATELRRAFGAAAA